VNRREKRTDGTTVIGVNPTGPIDREVGVIRLDDDAGRPIAVLVSYACHPVILGPLSYALSADFVGRTRVVVEAAIEAPCLFLQGCTGDLNPIGGVTDRYDNCYRLGTILGGEVVKTFAGIEPGPARDLRAVRRAFDLPLQPLDPIPAIEQEIAELRDRLASLQAEATPELLVRGAEFGLARAERALVEARAGRTQHAIPFEVQALRLGDVGIAAAPAELFVEIGLEIKRRSPFAATLALGYANGCIGYVPVPAAYPDGGYEVDRAHKGYGQLAAVAPAAAGLIADTAVELLSALGAR
jgi:hypothetical protein